MRKRTLLLYLTIGTQLTSCSTAQDYLISAAPAFFRQVQPLPKTPILEYDFIQPRRIELPADSAIKIDQASNHENGLVYYSASGHQCYTISLVTLRSACNVDGQWVALAPILNY